MKTIGYFLLGLVFIGYSCGNNSTSSDASKCCSAKTQDSICADTSANIVANKAVNDAALFVAGLAIDSTSELYALSQTEEFKKYQKDMDVAWGKFNQVADKIREWKNKEISQVNDTINTLFYPFGGPDYLFANIFFPNASNYILIGLENPGSSPMVSKTPADSLKGVLRLYKKSIEDVIQLSFFRTLDMNEELKTQAIDGATPLIMLFLVRSGKEIVDVTPMNLNDEGKLIPVEGNEQKHMAEVISFRTLGDNKLCKVTYLSTNLADPSLSQYKGFMAYLNSIDDKSYAFVKSATYLMHKNYFSIIRNTVLDKALLVLQDNSGIAYKFFKQDKWDIELFGVYEKPIPLFKDFYEADLEAAFKKGSTAITFRYGYNRNSNMLLAKKK